MSVIDLFHRVLKLKKNIIILTTCQNTICVLYELHPLKYLYQINESEQQFTFTFPPIHTQEQTFVVLPETK